MPCGCFGKKSAQKSVKSVSKEEEAQGIASSLPPPSEPNGRGEDDPVKAAKRRDVVASYYGDQCALLGYRPTGSRPPSCVDAPSSPSRTPSTAPLVPSPSPPLSASPTSDSPSTQLGASCRAQLDEKRREFFRDFIPEDERYVRRNYSNNSSTTLPTVARARHFGEVRAVRPVSQPPTSCSPPMAPPPGPHLLRPTPPTSKIDFIHSQEENLSFSSATFLRELREASDEMSRRWGMALDEDGPQVDLFESPFDVPISKSKIGTPISQADTQVLEIAPQGEFHSSSIPSNLTGDETEYLLGDIAGSNSSSPDHSYEHDQAEGQNTENMAPLLPPDDSSSSSHADIKADSSRAVQEPSSLIDYEDDPPPVIKIIESESEYSQGDIVLIDGEKVFVENVEPDSVFLYEDFDQEHHPTFTPVGFPYDIGLGALTSEELQPILETDSDQESESEPSMIFNTRTDLTHDSSLMTEQQDLGAIFINDSPAASLDTDLSGTKFLVSTNIHKEEKDPDFEYDRPAKISKIEEDKGTDLLIQDEQLSIIHQSSSDVD